VSDGELSLDATTADSICRVAVAGDVDLLTAPRLPEEIAAVLSKNGIQGVVLDLADVSFMDSSGLRALLQAQELTKERGTTFALSVPPGQVARLLELAGVADWFDYE